MQNRYTADLGDFGKYGLLRALCFPGNQENTQNLSLGMVWYLVPDDINGNDGKHINYLRPTTQNENRFGKCDPFLYDALRKIITSGTRQVSTIPKSGIFPPDTIYFEEALSFNGMTSSGDTACNMRLAYRKRWLVSALDATANCDVVFVDPDNGLEVSVRKHQKPGPKYVYYDELSPFLLRGQSLVIYHHLSRNGSAEEQIEKRSAELSKKVEGAGDCVLSLCYHRGTARVFFIIPSEKHKNIIHERIKYFLQGPWSKHFY